MDINNIIDKLNNELDKLNNLKQKSVNPSSFFTDNENFNKDFSLDESELSNTNEDDSIAQNKLDNNINLEKNTFNDIPPDDETLSLVTLKEQRLLSIQTMFKKSIRVSLKSFLISISLSFLNLFI